MHYLALETWSLAQSPIHRIDPRAKIVAVFAALLAVASADSGQSAFSYAGYFSLVTVAALWSRLPLLALLLRTFIVLPFIIGVVILNLMGGDLGRALEVVVRAVLSSYVVLLMLATTPFPRLLLGLESLGLPSFFLMILHFVHRYLFLLIDQARNLRDARNCRAPAGERKSLFQAAAGMIALLFARSYGRAGRVHSAMLARGFSGKFLALHKPRMRVWDWLFLAVALAGLLFVRVAGSLWAC